MILILYILTFLQFNYQDGHGIKTCSEPLSCWPNITINCSIIECLTNSIERMNYELTNNMVGYSVDSPQQPLKQNCGGFTLLLQVEENNIIEFNDINHPTVPFKFFKSSVNSSIYVFPVKHKHVNCSLKTFLLNHHYEGCHNQFLGFKKICFQQNNYFVSISSELKNSTHHKFNVYVRHLSNSATSGEPIEVLVKWSDNNEMLLAKCEKSDVNYAFKCQKNVLVEDKHLDEPFNVSIISQKKLMTWKVGVRSKLEHTKCEKSKHCMGITSECIDQHNCSVLASIKFNPEYIEFQIRAWIQSTYRGLDYSVSAVISDDEKEGDDLEVTCIFAEESGGILYGTHNGRDIENVKKVKTTFQAMPYLCSFKIRYKLDITYVDPQYKLEASTFDFSSKFHAMLKLKIGDQIIDKSEFNTLVKPNEYKIETYLIGLAVVIGFFVIAGSLYLFMSSPGPAEDSRSMSSKKGRDKRKIKIDGVQDSKKVKELEPRKIKLIPETLSGEDANSIATAPVNTSKFSEDLSDNDENTELNNVESVDDVVTTILIKKKSSAASQTTQKQASKISNSLSESKMDSKAMISKEEQMPSELKSRINSKVMSLEPGKSSIGSNPGKDLVVGSKKSTMAGSADKIHQKSVSSLKPNDSKIDELKTLKSIIPKFKVNNLGLDELNTKGNITVKMAKKPEVKQNINK